MIAIQEKMLDEVWVNPERMGGVACFKGTRVPVEFLYSWLADGQTIDYFVEQFPSVTKEQAQAVLDWSRIKICKEAGALETFA